MPEKDQQKPDSLPKTPDSSSARPRVSDHFDRFERRQSELWRLTFLILFILTVFFAWVSWGTIRSFTRHLEVLPIGLVVLVALFGFYMWKKTQEIAELRGLLRGLDQHDAASPSDKQLDQLFEMIARSQQGYRELIDSFDDLLLAIDLDGRISAANRSFADLAGLPFQQLIGLPLTDFLDDAEGNGRRAVECALPLFLERRQWAGVVKIRLKNHNTLLYFDCVAHAMVRGNSVSGITILARDITALRENEARFTELFEKLQEGIYITTPGDSFVDANPALVRMLGYSSKEELMDRPFSKILADPAEIERIQREAEAGSSFNRHEIVLLRRDGTPITCLNTATAVRDQGGRVLRYQGALMDITARREMERRLYKEQEFARRLVDSFPDLILVLDSTAHFTFISPRIKDILGYEVDEGPEMQLGDRTHPEDRTALLSLLDDVLTGKQAIGSLEVRARHKQGGWRLMRCSLSPLFAESGKIEGVVISARDVTQLKRLEEKLIQSEKLAAMGQMLAGVAHELNNPLTAVLGVTELLRERTDLDDVARRQLDLTHRQARRAARIVQNLLDFSRPAALQKKVVDLNSILERTLQLHEHALLRSNVALEFYPDALPAMVVGDSNQLIQVFLNLVSNGEHAIREVRDSGRIQVRIQHSGDRIGVTVQDDGIGIRPEALPKLFDPFYTTKRPGGGTGLGLSICMSIIREHLGTIEVEALPAGGSAFTIFLPAAAQPQSALSPLDTVQPSSGALRQMADLLKGRSILVVDDEESIRILLQEGLSVHGLHVDSASSCEEALSFASRIHYDAVLCDLHLAAGGVSGKETAEKISSLVAPRKLPILFITGDLAQPDGAGSPGERLLRLQKPFRISDVLSLLNEVLAVGKESVIS
jgi:PAS domain S-box-containing protein